MCTSTLPPLRKFEHTLPTCHAKTTSGSTDKICWLIDWVVRLRKNYSHRLLSEVLPSSSINLLVFLNLGVCHCSWWDQLCATNKHQKPKHEYFKRGRPSRDVTKWWLGMSFLLPHLPGTEHRWLLDSWFDCNKSLGRCKKPGISSDALENKSLSKGKEFGY